MLVSETRIVVRYSETDQMGSAHHAQFFNWIDTARADYFKCLGFRYKEIEAAGIVCPVVHVEAKYHWPAYYDDEVILKTRLAAFTRVKLDFRIDVFGPEDRKLVTARTVLGVLDREKRRPKVIPENIQLKFKEAMEN